MRGLIFLLFILVLLGCTKNNDGISTQEMVLIPSGEFMMGSDSVEALYVARNFPRDCDMSWFTDQFPKHKVKVDSFLMDKYEVTYQEFKEFLISTNYKSQGDWKKYYQLLRDSLKMKKTLSPADYQTYLKNIKSIEKFPVVGVTWEDAMKYSKWKGKRLPTEAEWEYVAKGREKILAYPWGMNFDSTKSNVQNKIGPRPVGSYPPNSYGIYDLGGNATEWCFDYYNEHYYNKKIYDNPKGPKSGKSRVVRGGSWYLNGPFYARSAARSTVGKNKNYINLIGFRSVARLKK